MQVTQHQHSERSEVRSRHECAEVPELRRLTYFFGQMLGVGDFQSEQQYFREKLKLHNRCFHGYGTVCGLGVRAAPPQVVCESADDQKRKQLAGEIAKLGQELGAAKAKVDADAVRAIEARLDALKRRLECMGPACPPEPIRPRVVVECGIALDCRGNEIIVRREQTLDLWRYLSREQRQELAAAGDARHDLWLSICFCDKPVSPSRPIQTDSCEPAVDCVYGKLEDSFRFQVSLEPPAHDERCEACCTACEECCLLLARIRCVAAEGGVEACQIDNGVRRLLTRYEIARITGIDWVHGATYSTEQVDELLGRVHRDGWHGTGLYVAVSRPIRAETLRPGVVELCVIQGGRTQAASAYYLETEIDALDPDPDGMVRRFRIRYVGNERLDPGDRVLITIRSAFILDACCQPLDGIHVGGLVPLLPDAEFEKFRAEVPPSACARAPGRYGPWTSGVGVPGGSFESWFFIEDDDDEE